MIYLVFYQSTLSPINVNNILNMKGVSSNQTNAKQLLYHSLIKLYNKNGKDCQGIILGYPEDTHLNKVPSQEIEGYICRGGVCEYSINIPIILQPEESKLLINLQKNKIDYGCTIH